MQTQWFVFAEFFERHGRRNWKKLLPVWNVHSTYFITPSEVPLSNINQIDSIFLSSCLLSLSCLFSFSLVNNHTSVCLPHCHCLQLTSTVEKGSKRRKEWKFSSKGDESKDGRKKWREWEWSSASSLLMKVSHFFLTSSITSFPLTFLLSLSLSIS